MVTKKCSGSERVQPDSGHYLAIEQAYQGAFASHPKGMAWLSQAVGLDPR